MMEAVSTSETSVNFYETTRLSIPDAPFQKMVIYLCDEAGFEKPVAAQLVKNSVFFVEPQSL
jgi:hypothetical protein